MPVNVATINETIRIQLTAAVNEVAEHAHQEALRLVPQRKVFRYGRTPRTNARIQGRQETRPLTVTEALNESRIRGKLGLQSAFPTTAAGRRTAGEPPLVKTALFEGNYRSQNRANDSRSMSRRTVAQIGGRNRLVTLKQSEILNSQGRKVSITVPEINSEAESDLSARGKYELKRQKNSAITGKGDERTLGGALRKTVQDGLMLATPQGKRIKATIQAGSEEVDYAKYVEFGTRRSRAQPFLRPALAKAREELMATVVDHLTRG